MLLLVDDQRKWHRSLTIATIYEMTKTRNSTRRRKRTPRETWLADKTGHESVLLLLPVVLFSATNGAEGPDDALG